MSDDTLPPLPAMTYDRDTLEENIQAYATAYAREALRAAVERERAEQESILLGAGPITCCNGKQHERYVGCLYCKAEESIATDGYPAVYSIPQMIAAQSHPPAPTAEPTKLYAPRERWARIDGKIRHIYLADDATYVDGIEVESSGVYECAHPPVAERAKQTTALYVAVNRMMSRLGHDGEISTRSDLVDAVMAALHDIDGGTPLSED